MQAFGDGPGSGPGEAHSGRLHAELDIGDYTDDEEMMFGFNRPGGIQQGVQITERGLYRLSFYYRARPDYPTVLGNDRPAGELSTYAIEVYAGGSQVMTVDIGGSGSGDALLVKKQTGDFVWEMFIVDVFLEEGLQNIAFRAAGRADSFGGLLDTISLVMIPEPSTYLLFGTGLLGIYLVRRRQRKV